MLDVIESRLTESQDGGDMTQIPVRELLNAVGRRAYGPLLLSIGLFSISPVTAIPGLTWASAAVAALIAGQMALGMKLPWLPRRMLDANAPCGPLLRFIKHARPTARVIDRFIRPRFTFLAAPPFVNLIALLCLGAALITIPLGLVPFAPIIPGLAILLFGLGMTAKDGLLLMFGVASVAGATALLVDLSDRVNLPIPFL